jgi:predicted DNA-binding transcriptional regulator YafY
VFRFDPYTLLFCERAWYAVGLHHGRGEVRKLKLNRFSMIETDAARYEIPKDFAVDEYLGNAWRMIRGDKRYNVELWFDAEFAETISDTHWHRTQQIDWQDDDSIVFRCTVDGLDEIVWWVLSMGPHCVVRKPKALADRVTKLAQQTASRYRHP